MTDDRKSRRGGELYRAARQEITARKPKPAPVLEPQSEEIFKVTFIATKEKGVSMDEENNFLIELIFKPNENKLKLRPAETQLLLAHIGEILKEIETECELTEGV